MRQTVKMEMIDFQLKDKIGFELEEIIGKIESKIEKGFTDLEVQKLPEVLELQNSIFKRFKLKVVINTVELDAAIIPFFLGENSIFLKKFLRKQKLFAEQDEKIETGFARGFVDETNVVLGGVFSEYPHTLYMNFSVLHSYGLKTKEVVAVLLHELGHAFYSCAYSSRMDRSNQILSGALRKGNSKDKNKFTEVVYKELKGTHQSIRKEAVENLTSSNPAILCKGAYEILAEVVLQQQEDGKYDDSSFEQMADNFSSRFGYGEYLVTSLEKLHPGGLKNKYFYDAMSSASLTLAIVYTFFNTLGQMLFWGEVLGGVGNIFIKVAGFFRLFELCAKFIWIIFLGYFLIKTSGEAGRNLTYDELEKRYNRIRAQIIEAIKNKEIPKKDAIALIESAEAIGLLIKEVEPYRGPLDFMFNTFNPRDRRAKNSIARQQAIEDLLTNDLFLTSMKLKVSV